MASHLKDSYGHVDILVNCAGMTLRPGDWNRQSDAELQITININLIYQLNCMRAFAPIM